MKIDCNISVVRVANGTVDPNDRAPTPDGALGLPEGNYGFLIEYPLTNPVNRTHQLTPQTTAQDILQLAAQDYRAIYQQEDAATQIEVQAEQKLPGGITLLNRNQTDGPYGIWGHVIEDLYFEGVHIDPTKFLVEFDMGS